VTTQAQPTVRGLVSVVVPTFNSGAWIDETLASVLSQTYRPLEVVVVDNGSTDDTRERAARHAEVRVVQVAERGAGATRSAGLDAARGEFVQFLDSDDLLEPTKIERQVRLLEATGADVAWGPFWTYVQRADGAFEKGGRITPDVGDDVVASMLGPRGFVQLGATLIRRAPRSRSIRFDNGESTPCEDVRYLLELGLAGARFVRCAGDSGLLFRQHRRYRWSGVAPERFWSACRANALAVERAWRERGELTPPRVTTLTRVYVNCARVFFARDRRKFDEVLAHLRQLNPDFVDALPSGLRLLARLLGYSNTERVAARYRALKRRLAGSPRAAPPS
jgi:glycosyltransferase involved in cell wall biosynthesis